MLVYLLMIICIIGLTIVVLCLSEVLSEEYKGDKND